MTPRIAAPHATVYGAGRARRGFAMIDVIIAVSVITGGLLVAGGLLLRSAGLYRAAAEYRRISTRASELADSVLLDGSGSSGLEASAGRRIVWSPVGPYIHLQAWGRDTASVQPLLELWFAP